MKTHFNASILFPFTFWIISHILLFPPKLNNVKKYNFLACQKIEIDKKINNTSKDIIESAMNIDYGLHH
jgi:hypothetical protein